MERPSERLSWYYTTICDKIDKWKEKFTYRAEKLRGFGIWIEAIIWFGLNYYYLIPHYDIDKSITSFLSNKMSSISVAEIIAGITFFVLAIGFLYHIGYLTEIKRKNRFDTINQPFRDTIITNGSVLFLAIFLPLLIVFLLASGQPDIALYILINIGFVIGVGFGNEWLLDDKGEQVVTLTTINCEEIKDLAFIHHTGTDYRFYDFKNKKIYMIPTGQVKEIIYNRNENLCTKCKGEGKINGETCPKCNGEGTVGGTKKQSSRNWKRL